MQLYTNDTLPREIKFYLFPGKQLEKNKKLCYNGDIETFVQSFRYLFWAKGYIEL
jgi:hypothetical protein